MKIASIMKNGTDSGEYILILSKIEAQDMRNVYAEYCNQNPRKKKAKNVLKQFDDDLQIW